MGRMPYRRQRRRAEHGLTLIEMLVTIALMTVGIVGVAALFANMERGAVITSDQATLEVAMRHVATYLQSPSLVYAPCAATAAGSAYSVATTLDNVPLKVSSVSVSLTPASAAEWQAGSGAGSGTPQPPIYDCNGGPHTTTASTCPSSYCDWGVQRLTVKLTSPTGRVLTRVVFKGIA
jgi:Tfp pilus assembly protein PilV